MKNTNPLLLAIVLLLNTCAFAQDADMVHGETELYDSINLAAQTTYKKIDLHPFPISKAEYNEITEFKLGYFVKYGFVSNWVFTSAIEVKGVLINGQYVTTLLEIVLADDKYYFTVNSESCTAFRKPKAEFTLLGCDGGKYWKTLIN